MQIILDTKPRRLNGRIFGILDKIFGNKNTQNGGQQNVEQVDGAQQTQDNSLGNIANTLGGLAQNLGQIGGGLLSIGSGLGALGGVGSNVAGSLGPGPVSSGLGQVSNIANTAGTAAEGAGGFVSGAGGFAGGIAGIAEGLGKLLGGRSGAIRGRRPDMNFPRTSLSKINLPRDGTYELARLPDAKFPTPGYYSGLSYINDMMIRNPDTLPFPVAHRLNKKMFGKEGIPSSNLPFWMSNTSESKVRFRGNKMANNKHTWSLG